MSVLTLVLTAALLVLSVLAHELAHGYVALLEGDDTAQRAGRLTWNPLRHVDPLLTLLLPALSFIVSGGVIIIGGAKPVPINPFQYRRGVTSDLFVSVAGLCANAGIIVVCLGAVALVGPHALTSRVIAANAGLIVFNLLPIRPLDGWRIGRCLRRMRRRRALLTTAQH